MAPIDTQIFPLQPPDETWPYIFAITIHNMVSSVSRRDLVWPGMYSAVVYSTVLYASVSLFLFLLLIDKTQ